MSRKHDKKKLARRYGGDSRHTAKIVEKRRLDLSNWIEAMGGAEAVHRNHLSAIIAAKPRKKGIITKPSNPYTGATIEKYNEIYIVTPPQKRGLSGIVNSFDGPNGLTDREFLNEFVPHVLGGFKHKLFLHENADGSKWRTVYVLPNTPRVGAFVRSLSVFWG